jgi:hypothetical protein
MYRRRPESTSGASAAEQARPSMATDAKDGGLAHQSDWLFGSFLRFER